MAVAEELILHETRAPAEPLRRIPPGQAVFGYALMAFAVVVVGIPILWMVSGAFKETSEIYQRPVTWWPVAPTLDNFGRAWNAAPFARYYANTLLTTILGSGAELLFAVTSAYAFAFLRFPKKDWIFLALLGALMVPAQVTIIPNYLTIAELGWVDQYAGIIVPGVSTAYGTFLLRQYFLTLPREVLEAARVDGAGHLRTLWSVVLPLAQPAVVSFGLISIVAKWNDFLWPLIVTNTDLMRVLPVGIMRLMDQEGNTQWGTVMAGTLFVVLPMIVVFLWAQRYIVDGISSGAVKG